MHKGLCVLLGCLWTVHGFASTPSASFGDALNFAKEQSGKGVAQIKNFNPATTLKNYQSHPAQTHYYGGVTQTNSELMPDGQQQYARSDVGKIVINTLDNQPNEHISKNSDFVKMGNVVKNNSKAITTGKYKDCKCSLRTQG